MKPDTFKISQFVLHLISMMSRDVEVKCHVKVKYRNTSKNLVCEKRLVKKTKSPLHAKYLNLYKRFLFYLHLNVV